MFGKITVVALTAAAMAAMLAMPTIAEENEESTEFETVSNEYYGLLSAISDIENFIDYDSEQVTRADFIQSIVSVLGANDIGGTEISFTDVDSGSELYSALSAAVGLTLISDSETFRPDDNITINEIYKICVTACGYGIRAEMNGSYPNGYILLGSELGIADGISGSSVITGEDAYRIIFNTLEADYLEWSSNGYSKGEGNVLMAYRNIETIDGIVTSNSTAATGSYKDAELDIEILDGTIGIDYIRYQSKNDYDKYLGYNVKAYVTDSDYDTREIVYIYPKSSNKSIDFKSNLMEYDNGYITDTDTSSSKKYHINNSAEVIYNGRADYNYKLDSINDITGTIKIIDNDGDNNFDYVIIDSYYYMKVASFDKEELIIRDKTSSEKEIDLDDDGIKYSVYSEEENKYIELGEITDGSVLAVRRSNDNRIVDIIILGRILSGKIDSYSEEEICVDGTNYYLSDYFMENDFGGIKAGKNADFYLGINDEIAALSYIESVMQYGYLMKAYLEDGGEDMSIKVFSEKGEIEKYRCASDLILDGTKTSVTNALENLTSNGTRQLIRYGLDNDGNCKYIDTSSKSTTYIDDTKPMDEHNNLTRNVFAASYYYRVSQFYPYFNIQDTIVFRVPNQESDDSAYAIGYSFADGNIADGAVEAYNVGLDGTAEAVVVYADNNAANINRVNPKIILVEKVIEEVAPDGEIKIKISGWENGTFGEHYLRNGLEILKYRQPAEIKPGDVVRYTENNNEIVAAVVEFVGEDLSPNVGDNLGYFNIRSTDCHYQVGSVYSFEGAWALISNTQGETGYDYSTSNLINVKIPGNIAVYNMSNNTIRTGTSDDIKTYRNSGGEASYILVKQYYGTSNFCVIYEQ